MTETKGKLGCDANMMDSHLLTLHCSGEHCDLAIVSHCHRSSHANTDWNLMRKKVCSSPWDDGIASWHSIAQMKEMTRFSVCLVSMATQCSTVPNFYLQWKMLHWKVSFCPNFVGGGSNCCHPYALTASLCLRRRWRSETSDVGSVSNASSPDRCGTWQRCQAVGKPNRSKDQGTLGPIQGTPNLFECAELCGIEAPLKGCNAVNALWHSLFAKLSEIL